MKKLLVISFVLLVLVASASAEPPTKDHPWGGDQAVVYYADHPWGGDNRSDGGWNDQQPSTSVTVQTLPPNSVKDGSWNDQATRDTGWGDNHKRDSGWGHDQLVALRSWFFLLVGL